MADLELQHSATPAGDTVVVRGEIDMATVPQLRALLDDLVADGSRRIVLDCRQLAFLDSSGIGVLVATRNRMAADTELVVEAPAPHVLKVLQITGVSEHLSVVTDEL